MADDTIFEECADWYRWYISIMYQVPQSTNHWYTTEETYALRKRLFNTIKRTGWTPIHTMRIRLMSDYIHGI